MTLTGLPGVPINKVPVYSPSSEVLRGILIVSAPFDALKAFLLY
jgi:hypothetical protein